jgi:hypothetical protein
MASTVKTAAQAALLAGAALVAVEGGAPAWAQQELNALVW